MFKNLLSLGVFLAGLLAVCWIGVGYLGSNPLGAAIAAVIAAGYLAGALELQRYRQATASLQRAVSGLANAPASLGEWLAPLHPSLRGAVRLRVEGERVALPAPALTPYLVGLLVLLGMLGTLLGMMATLRGTGLALESATDLQAIRGSLAAPVKGLGFAFGTSIAGVASSAMLGLLSALCRRERLHAVQGLDAAIAGTLRPYSQAYQREQSFQLLQQQSDRMPALVEQLQAAMSAITLHSEQAHERQLAAQSAFHAKTEAIYTHLASSVQQSLRESVAESARASGAQLQPVVEATMAGLVRETSLLRDSVSQAVQQQLDGLSRGFAQVADSVQASGAQLPAMAETTLAALLRETSQLRESVAHTVQQQLVGLAQGVETVADSVRAAGAELPAIAEASMARLVSETALLRDSLSQSVQQQQDQLARGFDTLAAQLRDAGAQLPALAETTLAGLARESAQWGEQVQQAVQQQLNALTGGYESATAQVAEIWRHALDEQRAASGSQAEALQQSLAQFSGTLEQRSAHWLGEVSAQLQAHAAQVAGQWNSALAQQQGAHETLSQHHQQALATASATFEQHATTLVQAVQHSHTELQASLASGDAQRLAAWSDTFSAMTRSLDQRWAQLGEQAASQQQAICTTLEGTARGIIEQAQNQAADTLGEISRLLQAAAEAPKAAAEVVAELRQKLSDSMVRDTAMLEERGRLLATLETLLDAVNHASTEQRAAVDALVSTSADLLDRVGTRFTDHIAAETGKLGEVASQVTGSAIEVASLGDALGTAVSLFGQSNEALTARLEQVAGALDKSLSRSDEQLAYYVAQAREVVDLSVLSQKQIIEEIQQLAAQRDALGSESA